MAYKRLQVISFFLLFLVVAILIFLIIKPAIQILALAIIVAILAYPVYQRFLAKLRSPNFASFMTLLVIAVLVLIPVVFFGRLLLNEGLNFYNRVQSGGMVISRDQIVQNLPAGIQAGLEHFSRDINNSLQSLTANIFQSIGSLVSNIASFLIALLLLIMTVFFLLRDGRHITEVIVDISPMATSQEDVLMNRVVSAVNGVVKGLFLTALCHGAVATVGFFIFGVPNALVWGVFTVLAALVPAIGVWFSLIPAVAYMLITGHIPGAIGLAIWAVCGVALIDNFVGPRILGHRTQMHPLLIVLSVLGGIQFFGILGFLIGPILMAIFMVMIDMYRKDFKGHLYND